MLSLTKVGTPAEGTVARPGGVRGGVDADLDRVEPVLDVPYALGRVPGDLGGADLAPPDRSGEPDGVVLPECVVPEGVHRGLFLESRHRYLSPRPCGWLAASMPYQPVTREWSTGSDPSAKPRRAEAVGIGEGEEKEKGKELKHLLATLNV